MKSRKPRIYAVLTVFLQGVRLPSTPRLKPLKNGDFQNYVLHLCDTFPFIRSEKWSLSLFSNAFEIGVILF